MSREIEKCPCGAEQAVVGNFVISCSLCGWSGGRSRTKEGAIRLWNKVMKPYWESVSHIAETTEGEKDD